MDPVTLGMAKADAKKRYTPLDDVRLDILEPITRTNLVKNPGLTVNNDGWALWAGTGGAASSARIADPRNAGKFMFRLTWTTATTAVSGETGPGRTNTDDIPVTPGTVVSASIDAEATITQRLRCVLTFYNASNATVGAIQYGVSESVPANTRVRLTAVNATVPAGAVRATIRVGSVTGIDGVVWPVGAQLMAGNALLEVAPVAQSYFDGSFPGGAWSGTAGASISTLTSVNVAPKESPDFSGTPTKGGTPIATTTDVAGQVATTARPTQYAWATGTVYPKFTVTYRAGVDYIALVDHTAGVWADDLAAGRWRRLGPRNLTNTTPPSAVHDYVNAMWARAHPELHPFPVAVSYLASGFSLTTQLGAGFTEHIWDATPPIRTLGLLSTSISAASTTFQGNVSNGSAARQPYDLEFILDVPDAAAGKLVVSVHDTVTDPKPGVQVWIDGRPTSVNMVRDASPSTTTMRGILIDGIGAGRHIVRMTMQSMDWRSVAVPSGVTVSKTTDVRTKVFILGDSWIEGGTEASPHATWPHAIAPTLARLFGPTVEVFFGGQGSTGYTTTPGAPKTAFGSTDRLDAVQACNPSVLIVAGTQNDDANHTSVGAAATALYSSMATRLPSCKVVVIGPNSTRWDLAGNRVSSVTALKTAAAAASNVVGGYVIDPHGGQWMSGNGHIGAPDGLGFADLGMHSDANHPTVFGAAYQARRDMEEIVWLYLRTGLFGPYGFTL